MCFGQKDYFSWNFFSNIGKFSDPETFGYVILHRKARIPNHCSPTPGHQYCFQNTQIHGESTQMTSGKCFKSSVAYSTIPRFQNMSHSLKQMHKLHLLFSLRYKWPYNALLLSSQTEKYILS